jgi:hypothetical protein|tara:strand:- start:4866 stop:5558 length:693 start_codon:yes stop_codon:yes gene_type:complete
MLSNNQINALERLSSFYNQASQYRATQSTSTGASDALQVAREKQKLLLAQQTDRLAAIKGISNFISSWMSKKNQQEYYEAQYNAQVVAAKNNATLTRASNEVALNVAEATANSLDKQANQLFNNAYKLSQNSLEILKEGNRTAAFKVGQARNAFAEAGVAQTGSAKDTIESIANNTFRSVDASYRTNIDAVNNALTQSANTHYEAALTRYKANAEAVLSQTAADAATGGN